MYKKAHRRLARWRTGEKHVDYEAGAAYGR